MLIMQKMQQPFRPSHLPPIPNEVWAQKMIDACKKHNDALERLGYEREQPETMEYWLAHFDKQDKPD
jgi:hypothetical protein